MRKTHLQPIGVASSDEKPLLSKAQKSFNSLIKQIGTQRALLAEWEHAIPRYQEKYTREFVPLSEALTDFQEKMVYRLDVAWDGKGLSKPEKSFLSMFIADMALVLCQQREGNEALKAIYTKHSGEDYDRKEAEGMQDIHAMMEDVLGIDLGEEASTMSPEELLAHAKAKMEQMAQSRAEAEEARRATRKKSAKQLAKEAEKESAEKQVSQSIREVYRKLASSLHPDRESDPLERERKTLLMQRVNDAYASNNLLTLLELQLELEHIDQSAIDSISEERLVHYNKVLKEQVAELKQENLRVEGEFKIRFGIDPFARLSPRTILRDLEIDIIELHTANRGIEEDLEMFGEIRNIKAWLKEMKKEMAQDVPHDLFRDLLGGF
ncbi:J domain-containing protein [Propionivibrio limicola]|uniref:J domain-containing protein n=1 Tax=Propionivibrio limicola TaxID=167645 RepID=UPI001290959E|nr:J domain-containing protein [Propionivibrio limicola]